MSSRKLMIAAPVALLAAYAAIGLGGAAVPDERTAKPAETLRCEIEVEDQGASVRLQGIVFSGRIAGGAYDILVTGGEGASRTEIRQRGDFTAAAHRPSRLGIVELRKGSGGYNAVLTLAWGGRETRCAMRIGEAWS